MQGKYQFGPKFLAFTIKFLKMVHYTNESQLRNTIFKSPFQAELDQNNRWIVLERILPWDRMVRPLQERMAFKRGRRSIDLRLVLGALLVKGLNNLSDEDTILAIQESMYIQHFIGLRELTIEPVFVPEVLTQVRKRLGEEGMLEINEILLKYAHETGMLKHRKKYSRKKRDDKDKTNDNDKLGGESSEVKENQKEGESKEDTTNRGTLKLDATVADQNVTYPVDIKLLNRARQESESIIDRIYALGVWGDKKPRTYRRTARRKYLNFSKNRRPGSKIIRKHKKQQLQFIARNIKHIDRGLDMLTEEQIQMVFYGRENHRNHFVMREVYRQQKELYNKRGQKDQPNSIQNRIISFHQPWVRPVVRGKAGRKTEFGAKVNFSETEGFIRADRIDFNNFNEALDLENQIEAYNSLYGYYPAEVLVDKIYLNRNNRKYLDSKGIAYYGPKLGRPSKMDKKEKLRRKKKQNKRSEVEGKFGLAKMKFGMNRIKMRTSETSKGHIVLIAIAMNIGQLLSNIFVQFANLLMYPWLRRAKNWFIRHIPVEFQNSQAWMTSLTPKFLARAV